MLGWNQHLFLLLNAPAHPDAWLVILMGLLAESPNVLGPILLVGLWARGRPDARGRLLATTGGVLVALGVNQGLGLMYVEPRPFMIDLGHTFLAHVPDNSFPSDHASFVLALGFGLILTGAARRWGTVVCVYGLGVGVSRLWLGVHFPLDIAASVPVGLFAGGLARLVSPLMDAWLPPPVAALYETSLPMLRLPPRLVPRRGGGPR